VNEQSASYIEPANPDRTVAAKGIVMILVGERVEIFPDIKALALAGAQRFALLAKDAVEDHGVFSVALSGGSTPKALYELLATDKSIGSRIPWANVHFFFGDERHVPPDHNESNFRMANEAMFQRLCKERLLIHRILSELDNASEAAEQYQADLREFFEPRGLLTEGLPRFDLILLGMGPDGHTASLFPNSSALLETTRWVVANWVDKFKTDRITMTFPVLNSAAEVILFVAGAEKAGVLAEVLNPPAGETRYPVQRVRPRNGIKRWMLDASVAARLPTIPS
jgi:6-phosphogluconolactonase